MIRRLSRSVASSRRGRRRPRAKSPWGRGAPRLGTRNASLARRGNAPTSETSSHRARSARPPFLALLGLIAAWREVSSRDARDRFDEATPPPERRRIMGRKPHLSERAQDDLARRAGEGLARQLHTLRALARLAARALLAALGVGEHEVA